MLYGPPVLRPPPTWSKFLLLFAVAFLLELLDQIGTRLDLVWRDELEAEPLEQGRRQRRLRERHRGRVANGEPQARVRVRADAGDDPGVEPQAVDRRALRDDLAQLGIRTFFCSDVCAAWRRERGRASAFMRRM